MTNETKSELKTKPVSAIYLLVGYPGLDKVGEVIAVAETLDDLNANSETLKTDPSFSNHRIYCVHAGVMVRHEHTDEQQQPTVRG